LEVLQRTNWVDIISIILIIRITYVGSFLGIGKQILPLFFLLFIQVITFYSFDKIALFISKRSSLAESGIRFVIYLVIISISFLIITLLTKYIAKDRQKVLFPLERVGGFIIAFLRSFIIVGLILALLLLAPIGGAGRAVLNSASGILF